MKRCRWTEREIAYLREHYGQMPAAEIARKLGRKSNHGHDRIGFDEK